MTAVGKLGTITLTTAGFGLGAGPWDLKLAGTFNGDTKFQVPAGDLFPTITNGKIKIDSVPTVANPVADVTVNEDAPDTVLDLSAAFADVDIAEYGDNLTLSVAANSNLGVVQTNVLANTLTLSYPANANGTSNITIRGTDCLGYYVEQRFWSPLTR